MTKIEDLIMKTEDFLVIPKEGESFVIKMTFCSESELPAKLHYRMKKYNARKIQRLKFHPELVENKDA